MNPLSTKATKDQIYKGMGVYEITSVGHEEYCPYCEWKGDSGPGAQLKEIIKQANKRGL